MKILEYTLGLPPFRRGGLPRYSTDLSEELAQNNEVYLLYPGQINPYSKKIKLSRKNNKYSFNTIEMKNSLPVSLGLGIKDEKYYMEDRDISSLKKFIKDIKPDVVHFHTLMGMPKEFLEYLHNKKIKSIYTTHDFYGLCPKMLSKNSKEELSSSKCSYDCMMCNMGPSYKKIIIMQSHIYENLKESKLVKNLRSKNKAIISKENEEIVFNDTQVELRYKLREYYLDMFNLIDTFHFNSGVSERYFKRFLPNIKGKIVSITHGNLEDNRRARNHEINHPLRFGYIGPYDKKKGFYEYTKILKKLEKEYKFQADFYGDIVNRDVFKDDRFVNHGVLSSKELKQELSKLDILIVPSLWHETFGYVVLEALLEGVPCLVSTNVGAKDLLPKNWIFESNNDLEFLLKKILKNPLINIKKMNKHIINIDIPYNLKAHAQHIQNEFYE